MYPAAFEYHRVTSVEEAVGLLSRYKDDAKLLAGGHSLVPMMKLRLAQPKHLVDIGRIGGLAGVREDGAATVIGALTTHYAVESNASLKTKCPMLPEAAAMIGDPQVRNLGTVGGSLAHADPAADWPAVVLALGAELKAVGPKGARTITTTSPLGSALVGTSKGDEVAYQAPGGTFRYQVVAFEPYTA